ncbi:MAG: DUF2891 domain-containing protein, partial [Saprospiraceae bacterium]|nr:DUF2891 domain-containing protein [Saprospiraceae bacterium]
PYKSGHVISKAEDLNLPMVHHPAFYGCFDWHSAVHGHWSLIYLMKSFPELDRYEEAQNMILSNINAKNIETELAYFSMNKYTKSFERTYGWAWLLKLSEELYTWEDPFAQNLYRTLEPLNNYISQAYQDYLPKLVYPIRVGEHSNTAFGLSFAWDYAQTVGDTALMSSLKNAALRFYKNDADCPIEWEPSGYDFLSPCLQEIDIIRKVMDNESFTNWLHAFYPELISGQAALKPGKVIDRSDGKLVHLDGLNFSRAWCLYPLGIGKANQIANAHMDFSLQNIKDGDYSGEHWLASFALYAYKMKIDSNETE